jgi:hypothetical protein
MVRLRGKQRGIKKTNEYTTYVNWGHAKILYLSYLTSGMEVEEIMKHLPNGRKPTKGRRANKAKGIEAIPPETGLGIQIKQLYDWRNRDKGFADAERRTIENPEWFADNIGLPATFGAMNTRDLAYMLRVPGEGEYRGVNAKMREMLLMQLKRLENPDKNKVALATLLNNFKPVWDQVVMPPQTRSPRQLTDDEDAHLDLDATTVDATGYTVEGDIDDGDDTAV